VAYGLCSWPVTLFYIFPKPSWESTPLFLLVMAHPFSFETFYALRRETRATPLFNPSLRNVEAISRGSSLKGGCEDLVFSRSYPLSCKHCQSTSPVAPFGRSSPAIPRVATTRPVRKSEKRCWPRLGRWVLTVASRSNNTSWITVYDLFRLRSVSRPGIQRTTRCPLLAGWDEVTSLDRR